MKTTPTRLLAHVLCALLFLCSSVFSYAQTTEQCLSDILHQRMMANDATYAAQMAANEAVLQSTIAQLESGEKVAANYTIPVVVHIIHLGEPVGTGTNISDAQVYSAIRSLNDAWRKKAGTIWFGAGVDTGIQFCLAQKDASGNPSTGIIRVNGSGTSDYATNGITTSGTTNEATIKALSKWNNTKYYNIWVVSEIDGNNGGAGVQGFAYFPGTSATYDGAVMMYNCFGFDPYGVYGYNLKSYTNHNGTLIHEMGHALNLYHTFQGDGTGATCPTDAVCGTSGDCVGDTPKHMRSVSTCIADATANTCQAGTTAGDYQHNYMDYSSDDCRNMFTAGQSTRMNAACASGPRASLVTATNLTNCGCSIPVVLFSATPVNPCLGIPVQFTDESLNFPTTWAWTFTGATPSSATAQNPTTTYSAAGAYNVTLQATTAAGISGTLTKTAYINPIGSATLPFSENFEAATFPPTGWTRVSSDAPSVAWGTTGIHQWERRAAAGNTGSTAGCAAMNMFDYNLAPTPIDNLLVKPVSLSGMTTATMTFKVAYKNYPSTTNYDSLKVFVSTDCGNTFGPAVYSKSGTTLATSGALSTTFTPSVVADWRTETVNLNAYIGQTIIVKFASYCDYGNNLYLDDVNITGTSGTLTAAVSIAETTGTNPMCAGVSATFTATPTNGGSAPTYQWQINGVNVGGATSSTFTTTTLTTGQVVTCVMTSNLSGVTGSPSTSNAITMTVNPIPATPTATNTGAYCAGATITLNTPTVAGVTYSWTGPSSFTSTTQNPTRTGSTAAMAGTYSVTVTSAAGCTSLAGTTAVVVNPIPATPTASNTGAYCAGATITLNTPTVAGVTYSWTGPFSFTAATQNPTRTSSTAAMAGTYSVTVTSAAGCTSLAGTTAVVVNPIPATPTASNTGAYCAGATITLNTPTIAGATYSWTGPSSFTSTTQNPTRPSSTTAMAGTYSVTVTSAAGCTSLAGTTTVVVNAIPGTPTATNTGPYCAGTTISLSTPTVAGATYTWTGPASYTSTIRNPTIVGSTTTMAGTYSVTITNAAGCTSTSGTTTVVVNPLPVVTVNSPTICLGATATLTGTGATTYAWTAGATSSGVTTATASPASTTTYTVTGTTAGCTGTAISTVTVSSSLAVTVNSPTICAGQTATLTSGGASTYVWTTGATSSGVNTATASPVTTTTYTVTGTSAGCTGTSVSTVTVNPTPTTPTITQAGSVLTSSSATGNQWYLNGVLIPGATSQNYTFSANGTYTVVITTGGCPSAASAPTVITTTGIDQVANTFGLSVYPNPNDGNFTVSFNVTEKSNYKIELTNALGQLIFKDVLTDYNGQYSKQLSVTNYGKGIYMISITNEKNQSVKKIIVY